MKQVNVVVVMAIGAASLAGVLGLAAPASASSDGMAPPATTWRTSLPAAAAKAGLSDRLSTWFISNGVLQVGLTADGSADRASAMAHDGAVLEQAMRMHVHVFEQNRFSFADKVTPVASAVSMNHIATAPKSGKSGLQTDALTPTTTAPFLDGTPYWGGDRIVSQQTIGGTQYVVQCTVTGQYGTAMMTAGHCGPSGTTWYQGYFDGAQIQYTGTMGTATTVKFGGNQIDSAYLAGGSYDRYIWGSLSNGGLLSLQLLGGQTQHTVCTDGSFTGLVCGASVNYIDVCAMINQDGTNIGVCGLDEAENDSATIVQSGDSGGPVFATFTNNGTSYGTVYVMGTISAQSNNGHTVLFADYNQQEISFGGSW